MKTKKNKTPNTKEKKDKAKKDIKNTLLDMNPNIPDDLLEELSDLLSDKAVLDLPKRGIRYYINYFLKELFSFFIIYVCVTASLGFFSGYIEYQNIYSIFIVSGVIALSFFIYKHLYFRINGNLIYLFIKKCLVLVLIFVLLILINFTVYRFFISLEAAIIYLIIAYNFSSILEHKVFQYIL